MATEETDNRAPDWYAQAVEDLSWAEDTLRSGRFAQACFVAQQAAEKALKALALHQQCDLPRSHSVLLLAKALEINGEIESAGRYLDRYYISGRYPDAYPAGYPSQFIEKEDAENALRHAEVVIKTVGNLLDE